MSKENSPKEWTEKKYEDVADIVGGATPSTKNEDYWSGEINWVVPSEVTNRSKVELSSTERTITEEGYNSTSTTILPEKTVMLTSRATVGVPVINDVPMATNQGFQSFDVSDYDETNSYYLYYQLLSQSSFLNSIASGGTFDEISKSELSKLRINIPNSKEQERIASVLYSVDKKLEQLHARKEKHEQLKQGLMQDLFETDKKLNISVCEKFKYAQEIDKNTKTNTYENLEDVIEDLQAGYAFKSKQFKNKGTKVIKSENYTNEGTIGIAGPFDKINDSTLNDISDRYNVNNKSVIISMVGANSGIVGFVNEKEDYVLNQNQWKLVTKDFIMDEYLFYYLEYNFPKIQSILRGSGKPFLGRNEFNKFKIYTPNLMEQMMVVSVLYNVDEMIFNTDELIETYEELKRGLMQDLLSGNVRTSEDLEVLESVSK